MEHRKERKRKKKKRGSQYFERRKHFNFKDSFYVIPFSPPPS
jgi:hypothetical protein